MSSETLRKPKRPHFSPDTGGRVRISTADGGIVVPHSLALRLWAGLPEQQGRRRGHAGYAALAYAVDPAVDRPDMFICVAEDDGALPPWPDWAPTPDAPAWHPVEEDAWVPLPDPTGLGGAQLAHAQERRRAAAEEEVASDMQRRCNEITEQGDEGGASFMASLDYYTTQRVKLAYLRMNAAGLKERLSLVRRRILESHRLLVSAPSSLAEGWSPPAPASGGGLDGPREDPNALCVPTADDYDVPETDGAAGVALFPAPASRGGGGSQRRPPRRQPPPLCPIGVVR